MTTIENNLGQIHARMAAACAQANRPVTSLQLLAVSKTFGADAVREAVLAAREAARAEAAEQRRLAPEPAHALTEGRPTKRDRRDIERVRHDWDARWSASIDR